MIEVIGIQFRGQGKIYYFSPGETKVNVGDYCVVETSRGTECGAVVMGNKMVAETMIVQPLKSIIRIATSEDMRRLADNARREKEAWEICQKKICEHNLDMKLVEVEYSFDESKILFYFTSDGRVDFRDLVKDLAGVFRTRIELRQIGVRDEAKTLGGLGVCGRPFCCSQFLSEFQPVSIKMAKEQGLSLNPTKISGTCGRLMCCLKYEQDAYEDLMKITPRPGTLVECADGRGTVVDSNLLTGVCKVRIDGREDAAVCVCKRDELKILGKDKNATPNIEAEKAEKTEEEKNDRITQNRAPKNTDNAEKEQPARDSDRRGYDSGRAAEVPAKKTARKEPEKTQKVSKPTVKPKIHDAIFFESDNIQHKNQRQGKKTSEASGEKVIIHDGLLPSTETKPNDNTVRTGGERRRDGNKGRGSNKRRGGSNEGNSEKGRGGNNIKTYKRRDKEDK